MADPVLNALDLITMEGLDRSSYIEDPEDILNQNWYEQYLKLQPALEATEARASATIGPKETNVVEDVVGNFYANHKLAPIVAAVDDLLPGIPFHDVIPDPPDELPDGGNRLRNAIVGVELAASIPALAKTSIKYGKEFVEGAQKFYTVSRQTQEPAQAALNAVKHLGKIYKERTVKLGNRYKQSALKVLDPLTPKLTTKELSMIDKARDFALEGIANREGFKRFLYTVDAPKEMDNDKMFTAFRNLIKDRIYKTPAGSLRLSSKLFSPNRRGQARTKRSPNKSRVSVKSGLDKDQFMKTAIHEFTHIGQMQGRMNEVGDPLFYKWASNEGLSHNEMEFFKHSLFRTRTPAIGAMRAVEHFPLWQVRYADKLDWDIKRPAGITRLEGGNAKKNFDEYWVQPIEISARAASRRWKPNNKVHYDEVRYEEKMMDQAGYDKVMDKLWMATPMMLDDEVYEDLK